MIYSIAADALLFFHFTFIVFVVFGAILVVQYPRLAFLHLPAASWGAFIEFKGWVCPLTPLENRLRLAAGEIGYQTSFIEHYLMPVVYPPGLTRSVQYVLGGFVIAINLCLYLYIIKRLQNPKKTVSGN